MKLQQVILFLLIGNPIHALPEAAPIKLLAIDKQLIALEQQHHIKIGVYAQDTNNGNLIAFHANDLFPFQSTCKFIGVSALLTSNKPILKKKVRIKPQELIFWHPISGQYVNQYVSLETLAEGAISYSDNPAINRIIHELGGLKAINQFAHDIGNTSFKLNHYESNLNSNPYEIADTSTPKDMALSVQKVLLNNRLTHKNKALLLKWMQNNTTGYRRIRSGVPLGWSVADKTGSGDWGVANDIGISWSPTCKPIVLSIFTMGNRSNAKPNDDAVAQITKTIFEAFTPYHRC